MHWFTQHFAVALLRGCDKLPDQRLCPWHAGGSRQGWHLQGTVTQNVPPGTAQPQAAPRHQPAVAAASPPGVSPLFIHPMWALHWTHSTLPTGWGFFSKICLDLRYVLIYYAESQTFSCSKKCHFTSPRVLPHYHFNKKQEQGSEARPPINSTLLSLASQPTAASVHRPDAFWMRGKPRDAFH